MYKVTMGDEIIYCEKYVESLHSLRLINKYTHIYAAETSESSLSFNSHVFTKTLKDVLLLNPSKIKIEEFDSEEFCKNSIIFNIDIMIDNYKNMIDAREDFMEYKTKFITKHGNRWYSYFIKKRLTKATTYIQNVTQILKNHYLIISSLETIKTLKTFDDMYKALKLV